MLLAEGSPNLNHKYRIIDAVKNKLPNKRLENCQMRFP
ncbi:hypothetical protein RV13_GL000087 [Enterococcus raffinosus]|nr:hypothetical protein RV13_GL000087 [Enterococcus raffinosus]